MIDLQYQKPSTERSEVMVYTDGSSLGNPGPAGWGIWMEGKLYGGAIERATNNFAEMTALLKAVETAKEGVNLRVHTDSELVIGWMTTFRCRKPEIQAIKSQIQRLMVSKNLLMDFVWVKGHEDNEINNKVDREARCWAEVMKSRRQ